MFEKFEKINGKLWFALLVIIFLVTLVFIPLLFGNKMIGGSDTLWVLQAFVSYQKAADSGDSFLWNPSVFSGFPTFISIFGLLSPAHWIFLKFFSAITAYNLLTFLGVMSAGFFMVYAVRVIGGVSWLAGLIGGLAWLIHLGIHVQHLTIVYVYAFLPLLFLFLWRIFEGRLWPIAAGGLVMGLGWIMGHWHWFIEGLVILGCFSIYLSWRDYRMLKTVGFSGNRFRYFRVIVLFILMAVLGGIIGSVQIIPAFVYTGLSGRGVDFGHWEGIESGLTPVSAFNFLLPFFDMSYPPPAEAYIGTFSLFFAFAVFTLRFFSVAGFFSWLFVFGLAMSSAYSPFYWLLHHIPPFTSMHGAGRWLFAGSFALSVLAGLGFELFFSEKNIFRKDAGVRRSFVFFKWCLALLVICFFAANVINLFFKEQFFAFLKYFFGFFLYSGSAGYGAERYYGYISKLLFYFFSAFSLFNYINFISLALFAAAVAVLSAYFMAKISPVNARFLCLLLMAVNFLFVYEYGFYKTSVSRDLLENKPLTASFISAEGGGRFYTPLSYADYLRGGVIPLAVSAKEGEDLESLLVSPENRASFYGLENISYFDLLKSRRMNRVMDFIDGVQIRNASGAPSSDGYGTENGPESYLKNKAGFFQEQKGIINFLGARFLISLVPLDEELFVKKFEKPVSGLKISALVYENNSARSRFYFADSVEVVPENEQAALEKLKTIPEEGLGVFIECDFSNIGCSREHPMLLKNIDGRGEIEVQIKKNTLSILKTKSETPQFLVFSENHLPGWKAYVDNQEVPIYMVGSVYMGIGVPEGEHEVRFEFTYKTIVEEFIRMVRKRLMSGI